MVEIIIPPSEAIKEINKHFKEEELWCEMCRKKFIGKVELDGFELDGAIIWMEDWCGDCIKDSEPI